MADKIIKSFTIGADVCKVDYNSLENKPTIPEDKSAVITALQAQVAALTPKKAVFTFSESLTNATIFDYYQDSEHFAEGVDYIDKEGVAAQFVYSRNGDFGFPCIDGTGQVNFKPKFATGKTVLVANVTGSYKNFKTPYLTCIDNLYRFTKVTSDLAVSLSAVADESEMPAYNITYKLDVPEGYDKSKVSAVAYRTDECVAANYKPINLVFGETNQVVDYSYSKESGLRDKSDGVDAQVHLVVSATDIPEGYKLVVSGISFDTKTNQYKAKQLKSDLEITIKIAAVATYSVTYTDGQYPFDETAKPASVTEGLPLEFKISHQTGTAPTEDVAKGWIDSIKSNNVDVTNKLTITNLGKNKVTYVLPAENITGAVEVIGKSN